MGASPEIGCNYTLKIRDLACQCEGYTAHQLSHCKFSGLR